MSKQPFLPLFFGDFLASTAEWTGEERSLYLTLLGYQWSLGSLPVDAEKVRRVVQWDRRLFASCWPVVSEKFAEQDGRLVNARLEQHRERSVEIATIRAEIGRKGGLAKASAKHKANGKHLPEQPAGNSQDVAEANSCHPSHTSNPKGLEVTEAARKSRRPSRRCPEDFEPDRAYALREIPDLDVEREVQKFRDWEFAKARSDWPAAWRTWVGKCRDEGRYARAKSPAQTAGTVVPIWGN